MSPLTLASIPCAVVPILGFLWLVWWLDRYDREPLPLFLGVFAYGAVVAPPLALIASWSFSIPLAAVVHPDVLPGVQATFLAPLVEEPAKGAVLLLVARSRHFDNVTDGFVYGAAVGLGFGMSENLLYFVGAAAEGDAWAWMTTVAIRTLYSALMHAAASSLLGAAIGLGRFRPPPLRALLLTLGTAAALGVHGLWNGLLTLAQDGVALAGALDFFLFPLEFAALVGVFQLCLVLEHRILRGELQAEAALGTLPPEHVRMLSRYLLRSRRGWLPKSVDHHAYVRLATTLALRRSQRAASPDPDAVGAEIGQLRREIRAVLSGSSRRAGGSA